MDQQVMEEKLVKELKITRAWIIWKSPKYKVLLSKYPDLVNHHLASVHDFRDGLLLHAPDGANNICCYTLNGLVKLDDVGIPDDLLNLFCSFVGNLDGLLCVVFNDEFPAVFNPIINIWTVAPRHEFPPFPIESSSVCYSFGKTGDDYQIVRLCEHGVSQRNNLREISVFSCSSGSWSAQCRQCTNNICHMCCGSCVDGHLNFLSYKIGANAVKSCIIYALSLSNLSDDELELPPGCSAKNFMNLNLFDLRNKLGLVELNEDGSRRIWGMHEYGVGSSWSVMFSLPREIYGIPRGYIASRNELVMVEISDNGTLLVYHVDKNNVRQLERKIKGDDDPSTYIETCIASLVSPSHRI